MSMPEFGDCPNFRGHRPGTDAKRWSALVGENGTVPFNGAPVKFATADALSAILDGQ